MARYAGGGCVPVCTCVRHRFLDSSERSELQIALRAPPDSNNRKEEFNGEVFRRLGELGLLGVTVSPEFGGSGMDATAACIVHEELSAADPAACLSYLGESSFWIEAIWG